MTLALLCSGQGRQHPDMFALTHRAPEAAGIFEAATIELDGTDPRDLVGGGSDAMQTNVAGQILCCAQALAAHAALGSAIEPGVTFAGYSVGELAAWGCAGVLTPSATLGLARRRAEVMNDAGGPNGGLAFVRGLSRGAVDDLCARFASGVAIVNPCGSFVIGGERDRLCALCKAARQAGANRTGMLAVHVAAHTSVLLPASIAFRAALDAAALTQLQPGARLLSGIDGESVTDLRAGADKLAAQISQTVAWATSLEACVEAGVRVFLELGPGRALADMVADAHPGIQTRSIDEFRSLEGLRSWLARARHRH